jgi:sporulation protein YlmC with PRC-barrel domain
MRLTDLHGARVRRRGGKAEGMVWDVICKQGRVTALLVGAGGLLGRMTGRGGGRHIAWSEVVAVRNREVLLGTAPNRKRSRQARPVAD